jgi:hypothetical protein
LNEANGIRFTINQLQLPIPWKAAKERATFPNQGWNHGDCQSFNQALREKGLNRVPPSM